MLPWQLCTWITQHFWKFSLSVRKTRQQRHHTHNETHVLPYFNTLNIIKMFAATFQVVLLFGIWIKYRQMWCAVLLWRQRTVCAHIPVSTINSVIWHIASSLLSTYHSVLSHPVYSLVITVPSHTRTHTHARTHTHTHTHKPCSP